MFGEKKPVHYINYVFDIECKLSTHVCSFYLNLLTEPVVLICFVWVNVGNLSLIVLDLINVSTPCCW